MTAQILSFEDVSLYEIEADIPLSELDTDQLKELQLGLSRLGYPVGPVDGLLGPKTRTAWAEFKTDEWQGRPEYVGGGSLGLLKQRVDDLREGKVHDFSSREGAIDAIIWECKAQGIGLRTQIAYVLATTQWETANTFQPVRETFWLDQKHGFEWAENWRRQNHRYFPYYGRGYVQLTWDFNYRRYSRILGVDMVSNPDIALRPNVSLFVLVHGFKTGTFTGRKITDYISSRRTDFLNARRCINGMDKALAIKKIADDFMMSGLV